MPVTFAAPTIDRQGSRARSERQQDQASNVEQIGLHAGRAKHRAGYRAKAYGTDGAKTVL